MITGTLIRKPLTLETILTYVSEYEIFRHYLGHDFKLGVPFKSPFFKDDNPSASIIRTGKGRLHLTVFGKSRYNGKVIDFVRHFYPACNYNQVLRHIDRDMNLGICSRNAKAATMRSPVRDLAQPAENTGPKLIQVVTRPFTPRDFDFWGLFHLAVKDLGKAPVVYAIQEVYIDKLLFPLDPGELAYGYYFGDGLWKIYRPFAKRKRDKWRCNIPGDFLFGLKSLDPSKGAIQIKAVKDFKVVTKHYTNCYIIPYEGTNVINDDDLSYLLTLPWILICNDPDAAGIESTNHYLQISEKFKALEIPPALLSPPRVKDLADIDRYYDPITVRQIIKNNIDKL